MTESDTAEATEHARHFSRTRQRKISPACICILGGTEEAWSGCGGKHPGHYLYTLLLAPGRVASRMHQPQVCSPESILGMEELGWGGRKERKQKLRVWQHRWGKVRTNGSRDTVGCGARVRKQGPAPVRVPQEFPSEAAGPLGSYRPVARSSPLRPGEGVNLRSPQASCCALKQPSAPGDLGSQVNNLKP